MISKRFKISTIVNINWSLRSILFHQTRKFSLNHDSLKTDRVPANSVESINVPVFTDHKIEGIVEDVGDLRQPGGHCLGCGVLIQTSELDRMGYVPPNVFAKFINGRIKTFTKLQGERLQRHDGDIPMGMQIEMTEQEAEVNTRLLVCQRCFNFQKYKKKVAISRNNCAAHDMKTRSLTVGDISEIKTPNEVIERIVYAIRPGSLILQIVDATDFESTIVPELFEACRKKHLDIVWVINKFDCLPIDSQNPKELLHWVRRFALQMRNPILSQVVFVSSITGYNFPLLEKVLHRQIDQKKSRYIYVLGRVNCGKSTFVHQFLKFIGYKHLGTSNVKSNTGPVTQSYFPGTTVNFIPFTLPKGYKIIDSPGIPGPQQLPSLFESNGDLSRLIHVKNIKTIQFLLKEDYSLLIGGVAKIDLLIGSGNVILRCQFPKYVTMKMCKTSNSFEIMKEESGRELTPPTTPLIKPLTFSRHTIEIFATSSCHPVDEISIAGLGWITPLKLEGHKKFYVWSPKDIHVFKRPALPISKQLKMPVIRSSDTTVDRNRIPQKSLHLRKENDRLFANVLKFQ